MASCRLLLPPPLLLLLLGCGLVLGTPAARGAASPLRLIIDSDAGADDAIAILLAVAMARAGTELMAVTCVHGNTQLDNVLVNVLKTLDTANRMDIPVYRGARRSFIWTPPSDHFFGDDGFGDFEYPKEIHVEEHVGPRHAVNYLVEAVREHPGEVTVLALGSLTNIALAALMDEHFLDNVKQLVVLGGSTEGVGNVKPGVEFNFYMDPEANYVVFNSTRKPILLVPWETVKERNYISVQWRKEVLGKVASPMVELLNKAEGKALATNAKQWVSADPMAAAVLLWPELITTSSRHHVHAEIGGDASRGALFVDYADNRADKNAIIVKDIDVEKYKQLLLKALS